MSRSRNEFRSFEPGAKAVFAFLILFSFATVGIPQFAQVLSSLLKNLAILAFATGAGSLAIFVGFKICRNRRKDPFVFQKTERRIPYPEKGPLSTLVWPDDKGTTLRPPAELPNQVSSPVPVQTTSRATDKAPVSKPWTEAEILGRIHRLDWYQFEKFNVALLRAEGWETTHFRSEHGDGGKDIVAEKDEQILYVQCKALRKPVPENVVRELEGSISIAQIASGAIHASGPFSESAMALASRLGIRLFDGWSLAARARKCMRDDQLETALIELPHLCPNCDSEMVLREGAFDPFWGCPRYPRCRGKINCRRASGPRQSARVGPRQ
jgi:restriction system protein